MKLLIYLSNFLKSRSKEEENRQFHFLSPGLEISVTRAPCADWVVPIEFHCEHNCENILFITVTVVTLAFSENHRSCTTLVPCRYSQLLHTVTGEKYSLISDWKMKTHGAGCRHEVTYFVTPVQSYNSSHDSSKQWTRASRGTAGPTEKMQLAGRCIHRVGAGLQLQFIYDVGDEDQQFHLG